MQQLSDLFSQIFENGKIIKIGVGIAGDFSKICNKKCLNIKNVIILIFFNNLNNFWLILNILKKSV